VLFTIADRDKRRPGAGAPLPRPGLPIMATEGTHAFPEGARDRDRAGSKSWATAARTWWTPSKRRGPTAGQHPQRPKSAQADSSNIRKAAIKYKIPYITTTAAAIAAAKGIAAFEPELVRFQGRQGIGVISDTDPQPLIITPTSVLRHRHRGPDQQRRGSGQKGLCQKAVFSGTTDGITNPTEVVAMLICQEDSFEAGIRHAQETIQGSCSLLLLTEKGIYAARDRLGRTPLVIGRRRGRWRSARILRLPQSGF
jgi:hypothetical protein